MRIAVVTLAVSLAATAALTAPSAGAAQPADQSHWSSPVALGSEFGVDLEVAPDGSAQVQTFRYTPNICPSGCDAEDFYQRGTDGAWAKTLDPVDAYDGQSRGWDLGSRAADPDTQQVTIRSRPSGGAWGAAEDVPDATLPAGTISARLVFTPDDRPVVVTTRPAGESFELRIAERRVDGTWLTSSRSITSANARAVATAAGAVRVAWSSGDTAVVVAERLSDGSWAPDSTVPGATGTPLWAGPDSLTTVSSGTHQLVAADRNADGAWVVHGLGGTGFPPAAVAHSGGKIDLAWTEFDGDVMTASRTGDGWSRPVRLGRLNSSGTPDLTSDPEGNLTIGWVDNSFRTHLRQRPAGGSWLPELTVPAALRDNSEMYVQVGADASGKVTVVAGRANVAVLTPPATVTQVSTPAFHGWTPRPAFQVRWSTTWTRTTGHDVRYRVYPSRFRGSFLGTPLVNTPAGSLVEGGPAGTYCLQARARADSLVVGPWSPRRCVTSPLDDRSFVADRHWTRTNGETRTHKRGATLVLREVRASRLALRVDRHSRGVVRVSFDGRSLGTFRLSRGRGPQHRIVELGKLAKARHGRLVVKVVSTGQPVRIEGVYAGR
jgi:hypothetical protein